MGLSTYPFMIENIKNPSTLWRRDLCRFDGWIMVDRLTARVLPAQVHAQTPLQ